MRNSRHGLRGVRLGEASNPGPPGRRTRDSAEEVLDNLERELTLCRTMSQWFGLRQAGMWFPGSVPVTPSWCEVTDWPLPASPRALQGVAQV